MTEITIPKDVYDRQLGLLREAYGTAFGEGALSNARRSFSHAATVQRYALVIDFWTRQTPAVKPGLSIDDVARHAICTNAIQQAQRTVEEYGIAAEVDRVLRML